MHNNNAKLKIKELLLVDKIRILNIYLANIKAVFQDTQCDKLDHKLDTWLSSQDQGLRMMATALRNVVLGDGGLTEIDKIRLYVNSRKLLIDNWWLFGDGWLQATTESRSEVSATEDIKELWLIPLKEEGSAFFFLHAIEGLRPYHFLAKKLPTTEQLAQLSDSKFKYNLNKA
jgi:hypothetical protein